MKSCCNVSRSVFSIHTLCGPERPIQDIYVTVHVDETRRLNTYVHVSLRRSLNHEIMQT